MQRTVRSIATGIRRYIQRNDLLNTIFHIGYRLINYASLVLIFEVAVLLAEDADWVLAADWSGCWDFLSYDQLRFFGRSDPSLFLDDKFLDQAFARGDRCYAYVEDGTLGAYTWYSTNRLRFKMAWSPPFIQTTSTCTRPSRSRPFAGGGSAALASPGRFRL